MSLPWNAFFHNGDSPKNAQRTVSTTETVLCEPALDGLLIEVGREGIEPSRTHRPGDFKSPASTISPPPPVVLTCHDINILWRIRQSFQTLVFAEVRPSLNVR